MEIPDYRDRFSKAVEYFRGQIATLRTGRASPALVENVMVESYGAKMPLIQLASITTTEARQIVIQPWDAANIKPIEKAILASPLGLTPSIDGPAIRLILPALNEERRKDLIKVLGQYSEAARVAIRKVREDCLNDWKDQKRQGSLSEDALTKREKELQASVDDQHELIANLAAEKETEIKTV